MENEVRKLPKKTVVYLIIMGIIGVLTIFIVSNGQAIKVERILSTTIYKNVSEVKVHANHQFLREDTNVKGIKYTVAFYNKDTNEDCKGFVLKDFKRNVTTDLICKKREI